MNWSACANFAAHLYWHKSTHNPETKGQRALGDHNSEPKCFSRRSLLFTSTGNLVECKRSLLTPWIFGRDSQNCAPAFTWHDQLFLVHRSLCGSPPMRVDSTAHILTSNGPKCTGRTAQLVVFFIQHMLEEARSEAFRTGAVPEELGAVELFEIALLPEPNNPPFSWGMEDIGWHHLVFLPRGFFGDARLSPAGPGQLYSRTYASSCFSLQCFLQSTTYRRC